MTSRNVRQLESSRAQNPDNGEVVVEVCGYDAHTYCYKRNGLVARLQVKYPRLLGWLPFAKNPKLILFRGETLIVRIGEGKSFVVNRNGCTEIPNDLKRDN